MKQSSKKKKSSLKRDFIEWGLILGVAGTLYLTGLHTEVIGGMQRVLLWTGFMTPDIELADEETKTAQYNMPLQTLDGQYISLQDFQGKTIFLNFWATWCPPCIAEMPNIQQLYEDVKSDQIAFVMVSLDEQTQVAQAFIDRKEFTFPVYFLTGSKPGIYDSSVVPTTYIISPDGRIVSERRGMANYNTPAFKKFIRSF